MNRRYAFALALVVAAAAAGVAIAAVGGDDDKPLTGPVREKAIAAALAHTGGGTVLETELGDDGAAYGVEIRLDHGGQVEVELDETLDVIGVEPDEDAPGGDEESVRGARTTRGLPRGSEPVKLARADFVRRIDNPYSPLAPGSRWVYREIGDDGTTRRIEVTVTGRTKRILGIDATVVREIVTEGDEVKEDTHDWFAQDRWGNVWYLGEATKEYDDGRVRTDGSWEAGVDGAQPGIVMPAHPAVGTAFRQEYYAGEAEDEAKVVSRDVRVKAPSGWFAATVVTADFTRLEPGVLEHKFYARGVGLVLAVQVAGGSTRAELLRFDPGRSSR